VAEIRAPITGNMWKVLVEQGQTIESGELVAIIESMKLEIPVEAEEGGVVREVKTAPDQPVDEGDVLFVVE